MVFKCFMVLSFLINLIAIPAVGFSCLIDLMWESVTIGFYRLQDAQNIFITFAINLQRNTHKEP